jgi:hypothetical protein
MKKITKILSQDSRSPGRELNKGPPDCKPLGRDIQSGGSILIHRPTTRSNKTNNALIFVLLGQGCAKYAPHLSFYEEEEVMQ